MESGSITTREKTFSNRACVCLGENVCKAIDANGNKNGITEVSDIGDAKSLSYILAGQNKSFKAYSECTVPTAESTLGINITHSLFSGLFAAAFSTYGFHHYGAVAGVRAIGIGVVVGILTGAALAFVISE